MRAKKTAARAKPRRQAIVKPTGIVKFEPSLYYENLLEMRREKPEVFNTFSAATQTALSFYLRAKQQASGQP